MKTKTWEEIMDFAMQKGRQRDGRRIKEYAFTANGYTLNLEEKDKNCMMFAYGVSMIDALFDSRSSFFEVLFGTERKKYYCYAFATSHKVSGYDNYAELRVCLYHKMMCSVATDKLAYLNSILDSTS